jgi:hypothetical protein
MAMIDIEYRHSAEPSCNEEIRRTSIEEMHEYLSDLVFEMQMGSISAKLTDVESKGPNMVYINGKNVHEILEGLSIKYPDVEESCDLHKVNIVRFDRPITDWKKDIVEDIPDILMKNAISKVYGDMYNNRIL